MRPVPRAAQPDAGVPEVATGRGGVRLSGAPLSKKGVKSASEHLCPLERGDHSCVGDGLKGCWGRGSLSGPPDPGLSSACPTAPVHCLSPSSEKCDRTEAGCSSGSLCTVLGVCVTRVWLRANIPRPSVCVSWSTPPAHAYTRAHACACVRAAPPTHMLCAQSGTHACSHPPLHICT